MNKALLKKAQEFHRSGSLANALKSYQELLSEEPKQPDVMHIIGVLYAQMKHPKEALESIHQAIKLDSKNASYLNSKGNVYMMYSQFKDAEKAYRQAISLDSKNATAYNNLGNSLVHQNKLTAAKTAYQEALSLNPDFANAHYNYGILLAKLGEDNLAIKALKMTISLTPNTPLAYGQLGELHLHKHKYKEAIRYFKKRLEFEPEHANTFHSLGLAYLELKKHEKAIKAFEQAMIFQCTEKDCNHNLASAYLESGDSSKALNYYFRQLEVEPLAESYYNIGVLLMYQERNREAIEYLTHAAKMDPTYIGAQLNLGSLCLKTQNVEKAIEHYKLALELKPGDPEIEHILSAISQEGNPDAAPKEYLQHLFDQYAGHYDKHLTQYLDYKVPEMLHQAFLRLVETPPDATYKILDLGCGTGLCGILFKEFAHELIGIDISAQMIEVAKSKNLYDALEVADIKQAISPLKGMDLVLAADVFTYIGDLDSLFSDIRKTLIPGSRFLFSVEKGKGDSYTLLPTIRYAHSKKYLEGLAKKHGFEIEILETITLRKQARKHIDGYLVALRA